MAQPRTEGQDAPTVMDRAAEYREFAERQFDAMFPYGRHSAWDTEVFVHRYPTHTYFIVHGKVDVRFDSGRRETFHWKLGYKVMGGDPFRASTLDVRDVWGDSGIYDWATSTFRWWGDSR